MAVTITEEFDNPIGQYRYLDTEDMLVLDELQARAHTDLRSFYADEIVVPLFMYNLAQTMEVLSGNPEGTEFTMADMEDTRVFRAAETWSQGTVGPDASFQKRNTLQWSLIAGVNTTESVGKPVDLTGIASGELVVTFPEFPGASLNLAASRLELADGINTVALSFADANPTNGPQGVSWPVADLGLVTKPSTVRLILTATAGAEVTVGHIRLLSPTWTATKLDMDTLTQRLVRIFDRDGRTSPTAFPKVWRATEPPSNDDPLPVDSRMAVNFYTGDMTGTNTITLFLRGRREDFLTQLDLDGSDSLDTDGTPLFGESQATLEPRGHQPDYGTAVYNPRAQLDLETFKQEGLDVQVQAELERASDSISESWIEASFHFGSNNRLVIGTTETRNDDDQYIFPVEGLEANTQYLLMCDLEDDAIRCRVYGLLVEGAIDYEDLIFDSHKINDDFKFKRRKGRIGWEIVLASDAWIESIRSRGLSFGEIVTNNFESFTPVEGARLYTGATPKIRVPTLASPYNGATLTVDEYNAKSSDGSFRVHSLAMTGLQTNANVFEDLAHMQISFDLYYPTTALTEDQYLIAALVNERGYMIQMILPTLSGDQWQPISIRPTQAIKQQSGSYRFLLMQSKGEAEWWIDNLNIVQGAVAWSGRATYEDPWDRTDTWGEFLDLTDSEVNGVIFPERGNWLQIRGRTLTQDARIEKIYTKPKYSELGRMIWNTDDLALRRYRHGEPGGYEGPPEIINSKPMGKPTAQVTFDVTPHGALVPGYTEPDVGQPDAWYHSAGVELTFTAELRSEGIERNIVEWYWDFGDGTYGLGQVVTHTYLVSNINTIAHLRVTEDNGQAAFASMNLMLKTSSPPTPVLSDIVFLTDASEDDMAEPNEVRTLDLSSPGVSNLWFRPEDEIWPAYWGGAVTGHPATGNFVFTLGVWYFDEPEWVNYPNDYHNYLVHGPEWTGVRRLTFSDEPYIGEWYDVSGFSPDGSKLLVLNGYSSAKGFYLVDVASGQIELIPAAVNVGTSADPDYFVDSPTLTGSYKTDIGYATITPGTYYYKVTAKGSLSGETLASNEVALTAAPGQTPYLTWNAVQGANDYRIYRGTSPGTGTLLGSPGYPYNFGNTTNYLDYFDPPTTGAPPPSVGTAQGSLGNDTVATTQQPFSSDGQWFYFMHESGWHPPPGPVTYSYTIDKCRIDGTGMTTVISAATLAPILEATGYVWGPSISPDGTTMAFPQNNQIHLWHIDGTDYRTLSAVSEPGSLIGNVCWSPDSKRILGAIRGANPSNLPDVGGGGIFVQDVTTEVVTFVLPIDPAHDIWYYPTWVK